MWGNNSNYGYDPCGYGGYGHDRGCGFALIVVLFILLVIVGASKFYCKD
ncbi:YjcZ family sporulation protein [Alteribacillus sp. HJP-4]